MVDPIREMANRLARVERELHALATAPRAPHTSIQDGYIRVLTSDADYPELRMGSTVEDGDDIAFEVTDEDGGFSSVYIGTNFGRSRADLYNPDKTGIVLHYDDGQLGAPVVSCAWQRFVGAAMDAVGMSTTSSASFVDLWYTVLALGTDQVNTAIDVVPDGGVTGAVRIMATVIGGVVSGGKVPNAAQQVMTQTGISTTTSILGPWTVPDAIWSPSASAEGALVLLALQGRVTAGAGSIHVAPRWPAFIA